MQEDYRKNFILLSQVAKEKKYAQEYLGLLARRGDIGSIRIGKRWYTSWEWFEEFESDAKFKKAEGKIEEKPVEAIITKVPESRVSQPAEKVFVAPIAAPVTAPAYAKRNFSAVVKEFPAIDLRKNITRTRPTSGKILTQQKKIIPPAKLPINAGTETYEIKKREVEVWNGARGSSPSFLPGQKEKFSFFPKFAFGAALMVMFLLLGWVGVSHKEEVLNLAHLGSAETGVVAGAYDNKMDLAVVRKSAAEYMGDEGDRLKGNISLSRVVLRAAIEKETNQGSLKK